MAITTKECSPETSIGVSKCIQQKIENDEMIFDKETKDVIRNYYIIGTGELFKNGTMIIQKHKMPIPLTLEQVKKYYFNKNKQ